MSSRPTGRPSAQLVICQLRREKLGRGRRSDHRGDGVNVHLRGNKCGRHEEPLRDRSLVHERGLHHDRHTGG